MRKELEECLAKDPGHFQVWYTLDRPPSSEFKQNCNFCSFMTGSGFIADCVILSLMVYAHAHVAPLARSYAFFAGWKYSTGFICEEMVREHLPPPSNDCLVFILGPKPMFAKACLPALEKAGHKRNRIVVF